LGQLFSKATIKQTMKLQNCLARPELKRFHFSEQFFQMLGDERESRKKCVIYRAKLKRPIKAVSGTALHKAFMSVCFSKKIPHLHYFL